MRKSLKMFGLIAGAVGLSGQAPAPTPEDPVALIKGYSRPIDGDPAKGFSGAAWSEFIADAARAQFVMVGEQHGSDGINRFERALHRELARRGFTHSALEIGPYSTEFAERLIRSGKGNLQEYIAAPGHVFTIAFLFFAGEADMAEEMVASSPDNSHALFGLDQEFVGASPILAAKLRDLAVSEPQKRAVTDFAAAAEKDVFLLPKLDEKRLAPLAEAFKGSPRALEVIDAIRISARIYAPFFANSGSVYVSNLERETYMKSNFVRQFEAAKQRNGKPPKVFLKFGGYHAMRGLSGTDVPALANFLAEWGLPRNYRLVNLMVDCLGGEALNPQTSQTIPCQSYFPSEGLLYKALADGPPVQIVDLRALRPMLGRLKGVDEATRRNILAFDYYVAIKGGAAATPLGKPAN